MSEWISAETPPKDDRLVLVIEPASNITYAIARYIKRPRFGDTNWIDTAGEHIGVSYWRDLPEEPTND